MRPADVWDWLKQPVKDERTAELAILAGHAAGLLLGWWVDSRRKRKAFEREFENIGREFRAGLQAVKEAVPREDGYGPGRRAPGRPLLRHSECG